MYIKKVPYEELNLRMNRFLREMDESYPDWEICALAGEVNLFYFTGTVTDGTLFIRRGRGAELWVRRNYERALLESEFRDIKPMTGFKDIVNSLGKLPQTLYLDMSEVTLSWYGLFSKYLKFETVLPADGAVLRVRAVKSPYEAGIMTGAGGIADRLFREVFPSLLYEGISESELGGKIYSLFIENGYHGVSRFSMRNAAVVLGHIGFGESPLFPSVFNGASGLVGLCAASPVLGSPSVRLKKGDLVYIDLGFGQEGYNLDKTMVYSYGAPQEGYVEKAHNHCLELEKKAASMLCAGEKPSRIYNEICQSVMPEFRDSFMGVKGRTVPFLGHGIGLYVDEWPVLAKGFDKPLECGMTIAIEPKIGIEGVGMVGTENTYLITEAGAVNITGASQPIILCP